MVNGTAECFVLILWEERELAEYERNNNDATRDKDDEPDVVVIDDDSDEEVSIVVEPVKGARKKTRTNRKPRRKASRSTPIRVAAEL